MTDSRALQEKVAQLFPHLDERARSVWLTGEPSAYTDFAPSEPNYLSEQRCVALDVDRRWYNRKCHDRHGFVCEIP